MTLAAADVSPVHLTIALLLVVFNVHWLYQVGVGLRGLPHEGPLPPAAGRRRFAVLVPAHDEEAVIGHLVDNIRGQTYPRELVDVFVSADNCTDRTAEIAAARGARVLVRADPVHRSKTWNVRWALGQLPLADYDALLMLDADNILAADFIERMNDYLEAHPEAEAIQGYLDSKNAHDSWVTRSYALAFWYNNRFFQLARARWRLSAQLGGTASVFRTSCLARMGWDLVSLTEDLEFTSRLVLAGGRVHWNEWAVAYDEKPTTLRSSGAQRVRWVRGHFWCLSRYGPAALVRFLRTGNLRYLDLLLYLLQPGRTTVTYSLMLAGIAIPIARSIADPGWLAREPIGAAWLGWIAYSIVLVGLRVVIGPSLHERRLTLRYLPHVLAIYWWGFTWIPILFLGLVRARDQEQWTKTAHTRALSLAEVIADRPPTQRT